MLSFVLYENENNQKETLKKIIKSFLYSAEDHYEIYDYDDKTYKLAEKVKRLEGAKIYLIDLDVSVNQGLEFARSIRINGDYISPILLLSSRRPESLVKKLKNILYLNVINKKMDFIREMLLGLNDAYKIVSRHEVYTFSIFDELYRLPFDDIYYIEKNIRDDSVTVFTKDDSYQNYITIKGVSEELKRDPRFFKSHRSCVINLYNVASYDRKNNNIIFKNGMTTDLVARNKKTLLVEKLEELDCLIG